MRTGFSVLRYLLMFIACLAISICATKIRYRGTEATDLSVLFYGMSRAEAEKITGKSNKEVQSAGGSVVTYIYDRGYTGCIKDGTCDPDRESETQIFEIVYIGLASGVIGNCITRCQKGNLQLFFKKKAI